MINTKKYINAFWACGDKSIAKIGLLWIYMYIDRMRIDSCVKINQKLYRKAVL